MFVRRKRCWLLLETVIALILAACIATLLLTYLKEQAVHRKELKSLSSILLARAALNERLTSLFICVKGEEKKACLYSCDDSQRLRVFFDHLESPYPFSGELWGEIALKGSDLLLTVEGQEPGAVHEEVLIAGVSALKFLFLSSRLEEEESWERERVELPLYVKLSLKMEGEQERVEFVFWVTSVMEPLFYPKIASSQRDPST